MGIGWKRRRRLRWCSGCLRRLSGANGAAAPHRRPVIPNENSVTRVPPADTESAQSDTLPAAPFHSFTGWAEVSGRALTVAAFFSHRHTRIMGVSLKRIFLPLVLCLALLPARPAEIRLKAPKTTSAEVKSDLTAASSPSDAVAPAIKGTPAAAKIAAPAVTTQPAPPKEPEVPAIREDVQGNVYTNYTHGFRMYKAPSWQLIDDARNALPNAIVAMGTSSQSSLMVVGREKTKEPLDAAAVTVEKRLHEVYANYQRVSQRKTVVGGSPAIEVHYRGKADEHDWSGTLAVIGRGGDIFTVLGMTYADDDLIQIQENVIAKAIASLSFDVAESKKKKPRFQNFF